MSNNVYQINSRLFFDIRNGNLIIKSGRITKVYKRDGIELTMPFKDLPKKIPTTSSFTSWIKNNEIIGGSLVLYMGIAEKTLIAIIKLEGSGNISIEKVVSFNKNGIDNRTSWSNDKASDSAITSDGTSHYDSEYKKWLAYWNSVANSEVPLSEDYILKTQVVPPVCPSCPSCPSSGICTNCGGKGGSGTLNGDGSTVTGGVVPLSGNAVPSNLTISGPGLYGTTANPETLGGATTIQTLGVVKGAENITSSAIGGVGNVVDTAGNIITSTGSGTVDVLKSAGSGASNLLTSGASGAAGLARETVGGAVGLAKETVGGAVGLAKETVGGAIGLVKDAGSGIASVFSRNTGSAQQSQGYQSGQPLVSGAQYGQQGGVSATTTSGASKSVIDPYSYNGALVSKPSNYIPVTADFSAFAK